MKRAIIAPAVLAPAALDELKSWLAITTTREDTTLTALLRAAIETCEAFTGILPIEALCEEILPASAAWQTLATRPVQAIAGLEDLTDDGARRPLMPEDFEIDLDADGGGMVRVLGRVPSGRVAIRFTAGLAPDWAALPDGLRHGIVRLAAHHYHDRDSGAAGSAPPAAIAALWRPWRRMRIA